MLFAHFTWNCSINY